MYPIKELVSSGNTVQFVRYHDGNLWYTVVRSAMDYHNPGAPIFEFPVPISDIGNATFLAMDKAILFMRYIRKHLELLEEAKK